MSKPKLCISFSGGRTSAVMTKLCVEQYSDTHDILIVFANTGCEHPNTLEFVHACDTKFQWGVVWLEAVVNPEMGKGIRHKVVNYETASRDGEPFKNVIAKYGIPNRTSPSCTRDTKEGPILSYLRSQKWKRGEYQIAIGIRADEADRMSTSAKEKGFVYPLIKANWTKEDVINECSSWEHDLDLKGEHYGNCVWCWKKSFRKLMTLAQEDESIFDFPKQMEKLYSHKNRECSEHNPPYHFFRGNKSTEQLLNDAKEMNFTPYSDIFQEQLFSLAQHDLDLGSACGDSCEIGADIS